VSKKDLIRKAVIADFRSGKYSRADAALKLGLSERQVSRIAAKHRKEGLEGLVHGNRGRQPWNKTPDDDLAKYIELYRSVYKNFNYSHALETMEKEQDLAKISYSVFRRACRKECLGKVRTRRTSKARRARERSEAEGYMLQLDGSPHKWNGKDESCLIAAIDDASSDIPAAILCKSETTWACLNLMRSIVEKYGAPEFVITDRAGWAAGGKKRRNFSQFERACSELDIKVIPVNSAEGKGRVERLNRTWQDRLVAELEHHKIRPEKDCNRYIEQTFLPSWREKFMVEPRSKVSRYRPVPEGVCLINIFCKKEIRKVHRDHTVEYRGSRYRVEPALVGSLANREVNVHEYEDGTIGIFYGGQQLPHKLFERPRIWRRAG
jgi:transposase-like protein